MNLIQSTEKIVCEKNKQCPIIVHYSNAFQSIGEAPVARSKNSYSDPVLLEFCFSGCLFFCFERQEEAGECGICTADTLWKQGLRQEKEKPEKPNQCCQAGGRMLFCFFFFHFFLFYFICFLFFGFDVWYDLSVLVPHDGPSWWARWGQCATFDIVVDSYLFSLAFLFWVEEAEADGVVR